MTRKMTRLRYSLSSLALMLPLFALDSGSAGAADKWDTPYAPRPCSIHETSATADVGEDPNIASDVRKFLVAINKNASPFWELP